MDTGFSENVSESAPDQSHDRDLFAITATSQTSPVRPNGTKDRRRSGVRMNTNADSSPTPLNTEQRNTEEPATEQPDAEHRGTVSSDRASSDTAEVDQENADSRRTRFELAAMARTPREKQWTIPPQADKGPVNITLRLPEVRVDDSGGRHVLIGPEQADLLGSRLGGIRDWLQHGHEDWVGDDEE